MGHGLFHILGRSFPSSAAVVVAGLITVPAYLGAITPTSTPEPPSWSPTPTPTLTPTPDGALKILEVPEVFSITATTEVITAHHYAIVPEGVEKAEIGLWSRTAGQIPGPWRYHGLSGFPPGEPGTTTETSRPWPAPQPGVVYQLHARYRYDDQWSGPFFYEDWFDPTGPSPTPTPTPAPPPEILDMSVTPDETDPFITITTNGFVSYPATKNYLGFWYRQTMPPTPWTYMGLHPYANGQTEVEIPIPFELMEDVEYEFGTRVRTDAGGWETDFTYLLFLIESQAPVFSYTRFAPGMTSSAYLPLGSTPDMGDRLPASRLSFSFWAGTGPGPLGASRVDATFTPSLAGVDNLMEVPAFNGLWEVTWEREDWQYFDFYLFFNEGELSDLEYGARVYFAPALEGPWELASPFSRPNSGRSVLSAYISDSSGPTKSQGRERYYLVVVEGDDEDGNSDGDGPEKVLHDRADRISRQGGVK